VVEGYENEKAYRRRLDIEREADEQARQRSQALFTRQRLETLRQAMEDAQARLRRKPHDCMIERMVWRKVGWHKTLQAKRFQRPVPGWFIGGRPSYRHSTPNSNDDVSVIGITFALGDNGRLYRGRNPVGPRRAFGAEAYWRGDLRSWPEFSSDIDPDQLAELICGLEKAARDARPS
jgi:hypothetical protein